VRTACTGSAAAPRWPTRLRSGRPTWLNRQFHADAPNRLWVVDFTYVATFAGFCYFAVDVFSRMIVGWRAAISHVTIDLSASYAKAVREALPDAVLVADRFHLVRLGNDTVTAVRQRVIREHEGRRGRKVDPAWRVRHRLLTAHERLRPETFIRMWNNLVDTGDPGWDILAAYVVKEDLRSLLALGGANPERQLIRATLETFYLRAAASSSPEVHTLAATVEAWWPAIEAAITTGYSNARSGGYNGLAKHEGRNAFGFRNTVNQRHRIRWACTRQQRRSQLRITALPAQL
jgi:transposase